MLVLLWKQPISHRFHSDLTLATPTIFPYSFSCGLERTATTPWLEAWKVLKCYRLDIIPENKPGEPAGEGVWEQTGLPSWGQIQTAFFSFSFFFFFPSFLCNNWQTYWHQFLSPFLMVTVSQQRRQAENPLPFRVLELMIKHPTKYAPCYVHDQQQKSANL